MSMTPEQRAKLAYAEIQGEVASKHSDRDSYHAACEAIIARAIREAVLVEARAGGEAIARNMGLHFDNLRQDPG